MQDKKKKKEKKKKKMNRGGRKTYDVDQIVTTSNSSLRESSSTWLNCSTPILKLKFHRTGVLRLKMLRPCLVWR